VVDEMSHVDQYGFRHQFGGSEDLVLHYLCQQLHLHYSARRAHDCISTWRRLLAATPLHLQPLTNTVRTSGAPSGQGRKLPPMGGRPKIM